MKETDKNKLVYYYIASSLALLVPVPGRLAYGIAVLFLFNLQMLCATFVFHAIEHLSLQFLRNSIISFALVAVTVFYKQILIIFCPVMALTLGFCIYLPALATAVIEFFFAEYKKGIKIHLKTTMTKSLVITIFSFVYFLLRDLIGFGTLTLPCWKKILVLHLPFNPESTGASVFLATIPGSLVLISVLLTLFLAFNKKMKLVHDSLAQAENQEEK